MAASKDDAVAEELSGLKLDDDKPIPVWGQPTAELKEAPRIRTSGVTARDITREFSEATKALHTGELVRDEWFTLFESVGALEIMDPKMDSGYLAPGETLEDDYNVSRTLLPEEVVGIMDQLLCLEMAWHMGNPLSQTLFTSLYLEKLLHSKPKPLEDIQFLAQDDQATGNLLVHTVLRAYCIGLIKCCDFVYRRIGVDYCYEEEDFVTQLYNRDLLSTIKEQEVMELLDKALLCLQEMEAVDSNKALIDRLNFRKSFLEALVNDNQSEQESSSQAWGECAELLPLISNTKEIGRAVPESLSVKIQRKLASTVPPRPMVNISFESAFAHLKRLCQDGKDVWNVLDYQGVDDVITFCWTYQSRKPQPSVYIRALLQSLLFEDMKILKRKSIQEVIYDDLAGTVLPADLLLDQQNNNIEFVQDPRFQIAKRMNEFVLRARHPFLELFRCICQNRSRIRRTLCHSIYDWDTLQLEAEDIDNDLRNYTGEEPIIISDHDSVSEQIFAYPLSSWAYLHKLRQMEWIVLLGFELEIYQPDELAGQYWDRHLQYLTQTRISHLERIRGFVTRKLKSTPRLTSDSKQAFTTALSFLNFSLLEATAHHYFAQGLSCLYTTLSRLSLLPHPSRPYSTDSLRYELRFKPFLPITLPEVLPFSEFQFHVDQPNTTTSQLLQSATSSIGKARKRIEQLTKLDPDTSRSRLCHKEWTGRTRDVLRACIAAGIAVAVLGRVSSRDDEGEGKVERRGKKGKRLGLEVDLGGANAYHEWWVVPKVTGGGGG